MEPEMTIEKAEALGAVSAAVTQVLFNASHAHPDLDWEKLAIATVIGLRGLMARERAKTPALSERRANAMLLRAIAIAMSVPSEAIRIVKDDNEQDGPDQAGTIPVRRH